jgi:hypothetical protein
MAVEVRITAKYASCFQAVYYGREKDRVHIVAHYCNSVVTFLQIVEK